MKTIPLRKHRIFPATGGFTLLELLAVLVIIGVLSILLLTGIHRVPALPG